MQYRVKLPSGRIRFDKGSWLLRRLSQYGRSPTRFVVSINVKTFAIQRQSAFVVVASVHLITLFFHLNGTVQGLELLGVSCTLRLFMKFQKSHTNFHGGRVPFIQS